MWDPIGNAVNETRSGIPMRTSVESLGRYPGATFPAFGAEFGHGVCTPERLAGPAHAAGGEHDRGVSGLQARHTGSEWIGGTGFSQHRINGSGVGVHPAI